jgi:hypothetical protein
VLVSDACRLACRKVRNVKGGDVLIMDGLLHSMVVGCRSIDVAKAVQAQVVAAEIPGLGIRIEINTSDFVLNISRRIRTLYAD